MTEEEIKQKAKNVYIRCFDDDFKYPYVLHALEICVKETTQELKEENNKLLDVINGQDVKIADLEKNVEQAKKIIKGWLGDFYSPKAFYDKRAELVEKSEQFLKENDNG